jgi:hypothetical protein
LLLDAESTNVINYVDSPDEPLFFFYSNNNICNFRKGVLFKMGDNNLTINDWNTEFSE